MILTLSLFYLVVAAAFWIEVKGWNREPDNYDFFVDVMIVLVWPYTIPLRISRLRKNRRTKKKIKALRPEQLEAMHERLHQIEREFVVYPGDMPHGYMMALREERNALQKFIRMQKELNQ